MKAGALLLLALVACTSAPAPPVQNHECPTAEAIAATARMREFKDARGGVNARGMEVDGSEAGPPDDPWRAVVHYGQWTYGHLNRRMWARVNYAVTCHPHCCYAGPCTLVHDYLSGPFELWHESGERLAKGTFIPEKVQINNNCEGGTTTLRGAISPDSELWDRTGKRITLEEARAAGWLPKGW